MATAIIKWADIEAEAADSGFRERLVAVYRKYEGQPTDERDPRGSVVKVTQESFARHMGVEPTTFRRWVKATSGITPEVGDKQESNRRFVKSIASQDPQAAATAATATTAARAAAKQAIKDEEEKEKQKSLAKHGVSKEQREEKKEKAKAKNSAKGATNEWEQADPSYRGKALLLQYVGALFGAAEELLNFLQNADPNVNNWRDPASIGGALDLITETHDKEDQIVATLQAALDTSGVLTAADILGSEAS